MFRQRETADDLAESMRRGLLVEEAEDRTHATKLAEAMEYLDQAAALFDDIGMQRAAEVVTNIIEKMAQES
jgi:hypothetical protein